MYLPAFRWEGGLADRVEYDSDGNIKTQIVKSPFVQVICTKYFSKVEMVLLSLTFYYIHLYCRFLLVSQKID